MGVAIKKIDDEYSKMLSEVKKVIQQSPVQLKLDLPKFSIGFRSLEITQNDKESKSSLVILFNPKYQAEWGSNFRAVTLSKIAIEPELLSDELFSEVAWDWFSEALNAAEPIHLNGTITKTFNQAFSAKDTSDEQISFEIRASWSISSSIANNVKAWQAAIQRVANPVFE
ncbi:MAG: DUF3000 domain-containing protein [Bifidobacteriaceae bacterium]|jgi:hypothetical protein|nr:DUF3000 domain-containing protein [Bifidobacteriaceae bacterium]